MKHTLLSGFAFLLGAYERQVSVRLIIKKHFCRTEIFFSPNTVINLSLYGHCPCKLLHLAKTSSLSAVDYTWTLFSEVLARREKN